MRRKSRDRPAWIDPSILYSRQEIAARTGLTDDVLSFWIRRKLLVPEPQEGSGKGVHHRFHFSQVNVAVVLKALRDHFGANITTLKSLADTLQSAIRLFRSTKISFDAWYNAPHLADDLANFRNGTPVEVMLYEPETEKVDRKLAETEAEILASHVDKSDATPTELLRLAEKLGPGRLMDREIALAMLRSLLDPRFGGGYWLLSQVDGKWIIRQDTDEGSFDRSDVGPAMFLPIYHMVRQAWSLPSTGTLRALDQCKRLDAALKDAGVEATVTPGDDSRNPNVQLAREEDSAKMHDVYLNFFKPDWQKERDGDDFSAYRNPHDYDDIYWTPEDQAGEAAA